MKIHILILIVILMSACQTVPQEQLNHIGCQEGEIETDTCVIAENNNVGMFEQELNVESEDVDLGFLAKPKEEGNYPGVVMIHEWWGLNENVKEMAKILANEGYIVLAVDLYEGMVAADSDKARELVTSVRNNPSKAIDTMKMVVSYLKEVQNVQKVASLGWCFGGQQSLQISLNDQLDASVIYYGHLIDDKEQLKNIQGPVLGIFGEEDQSISVESVKGFEKALNELNIENEIYIYPGVGHAFANPSGSNYAKEETMDAWEKTTEFLEMNLKGE